MMTYLEKIKSRNDDIGKSMSLINHLIHLISFISDIY